MAIVRPSNFKYNEKMKLDEAMVCALFREHGIPEPQREYKFHPTRKWRLDYAWPDKFLAVEVEGGVWVKGRHNHPSGFLKDMDKYNQLTMYGWRLLRFTPQSLVTEESLKLIRHFFCVIIRS